MHMEIEKIEYGVKEYISNYLLFGQDGFACADDASLVEAGIVDSTGILEIVHFIEDTFDIAIPDHEITTANLDSVAKIATYVHRKLAEKSV